MPIARKPKRPAAPAVDVEALIQRGGSPAASNATRGAGRPTSILLRLPAGLTERLEAALRGRTVKLPRHTWILEAIHEKLTREARSKE